MNEPPMAWDRHRIPAPVRGPGENRPQAKTLFPGTTAETLWNDPPHLRTDAGVSPGRKGGRPPRGRRRSSTGPPNGSSPGSVLQMDAGWPISDAVPAFMRPVWPGAGARVTGIDFSRRFHSLRSGGGGPKRPGHRLRPPELPDLRFESGLRPGRHDLLRFLCPEPGPAKAAVEDFRKVPGRWRADSPRRLFLKRLRGPKRRRPVSTPAHGRILVGGRLLRIHAYLQIRTGKGGAGQVPPSWRPKGPRQVYNWLQYFSPAALEKEFEAAGLAVEAVYADVAGTPYTEEVPEFAVVAKRR